MPSAPGASHLPGRVRCRTRRRQRQTPSWDCNTRDGAGDRCRNTGCLGFSNQSTRRRKDRIRVGVRIPPGLLRRPLGLCQGAYRPVRPFRRPRLCSNLSRHKPGHRLLFASGKTGVLPLACRLLILAGMRGPGLAPRQEFTPKEPGHSNRVCNATKPRRLTNDPFQYQPSLSRYA